MNLEEKYLFKGSLYQHLQINLLPIIVKLFLCIPDQQLKFNMALRHGKKRACDEDTVYVQHTILSCGIRQACGLFYMVPSSWQAWGTSNLGHPACFIMYTSLILPASPNWTVNQRHGLKMTLLIASKLQLPQKSLALLICPSSWLDAKRSTRNRSSASFSKTTNVLLQNDEQAILKSIVLTALGATVAWLQCGKGKLKNENKSLILANTELINKSNHVSASSGVSRHEKIANSAPRHVLSFAMELGCKIPS